MHFGHILDAFVFFFFLLGLQSKLHVFDVLKKTNVAVYINASQMPPKPTPTFCVKCSCIPNIDISLYIQHHQTFIFIATLEMQNYQCNHKNF